MTILRLDFEFDFARKYVGHSHEFDLTSAALDPLELGIKKIVEENATDFTDEASVEELGWELENHLQSEVIMANLKLSNFHLEPAKNKVDYEHDLHYTVDLELWGKKFTAQDFMEVEDEDELDEDSTEADFKEAVWENFVGTHHNFDVVALRISAR